MRIEANNTFYLVKRRPSIFTNRAGLQDCYVSRRCASHGAKESDGHKYVNVARLAAEDGHFLRSHETLPAEITLALLRQWGFVDCPRETG